MNVSPLGALGAGASSQPPTHAAGHDEPGRNAFAAVLGDVASDSAVPTASSGPAAPAPPTTVGAGVKVFAATLSRADTVPAAQAMVPAGPTTPDEAATTQAETGLVSPATAANARLDRAETRGRGDQQPDAKPSETGGNAAQAASGAFMTLLVASVGPLSSRPAALATGISPGAGVGPAAGPAPSSPSHSVAATGAAGDTSRWLPEIPATMANQAVDTAILFPDAAIMDVHVETHQGFAARAPVAAAPFAGSDADDAEEATADAPTVAPLSSIAAPARGGANVEAPTGAEDPRLGDLDARHAPAPAELRTTSPDLDLARGIAAPSGGTYPAASAIVARAADAVVALASPEAAGSEAGPSNRIAPARSMVLQLAPEGLGVLSVRLHTAGAALDVRLEASDAATASLLDSHRDALATALSDAGYTLQTLSIGAHAGLQGGIHDARTVVADPAGSAGAGGSGGSVGPDVGRRRDREPRDRRTSADAGHDDGVAVVRRGSALFV